MRPRKEQRVKGTTRVSFGDRQLIKKLWVADKNSRASKSKRTREISAEDRQKLASAPHRRAADAYQKWAKKARAGIDATHFEFHDDDDRLEVSAMCTPAFGALLSRRERMINTANMLKSVRLSAAKGAVAGKVNRMLDRCATLLNDEANDNAIPLLTARKHSRATNYRRRCEQRAALFSELPLPKRARYTPSANAVNSKKIIERNVCEPVPRADFCLSDENVFYVCFACSEPVCATQVVAEANGAHDALYYHQQCAPCKR